MISYLKGKPIISRTGFIILNVNDVGYKINVAATFESDKDETVELFIHEHIREDSDELYGFATLGELELFELLISVNGIGPKVAISTMASGRPEEITGAIISENLAFFKAISGVGSKAAARIILDLKSKVSQEKIGNSFFSKTSQTEEVFGALESLGYKKYELEKIIAAIPSDLKTSEEKVRWCVKNISK